MSMQTTSGTAKGVPFALCIPSRAPEVQAIEEDLHAKWDIEARFFEKNPRLRLRDIIAWDTSTVVEDITSTDAGDTVIQDGNERKTIRDTKQDTGKKTIYDRDDD